MARVDVEITGIGGSVLLFHPRTRAARAWVAEHLELEDWQWLGSGFAVEPRYAGPLLEGMAADGLEVA